MSVVSVRLDAADEAWLRKRKLSIGAFAREAVHEAIRRREVAESRVWLDAHSFKPDFDSVASIRKDRESH